VAVDVAKGKVEEWATLGVPRSRSSWFKRIMGVIDKLSGEARVE